MKKSPPLDRADSIFKDVYVLSTSFEKERKRPEIAPDNWLGFLPVVQKIRKDVASMARWVKRTPHKEVAAKLQAVYVVIQTILDSMKLPQSIRWAAYTSFFPDLNTLGIDGHFAVMAAKGIPDKGTRVYPLWKEGHAPKQAVVIPQSAKAEPPEVVPVLKAGNGLGSFGSDQTASGESTNFEKIVEDIWICPSGPIHVPNRLIEPLKAYLDGTDSFELSSGEDAYKLAAALGRLIGEGREKGFAPYLDRWPSGEARKGQKIPIIKFNKAEGKNKRNTRLLKRPIK